VEHLFNPHSIVLHIINAAILLVALYFLLLKPVRKFMNARTDSVNAKLQSVTDAQQELEGQKQAARQEIEAARKTAEDIVAQSVAQAQEQAEKVLEDAHTEAENIIMQAQSEAESMRQSAREEMRGEVAGFSVMLASKILQREVNQRDHEQLVEEFLKKVV
jgi:F-type H+-transporting ATPase subunit b